MKHYKLVIALVACFVAAFALLGCTQSGDDTATGPQDAGGFEEYPIGDDLVLGPLNVAGVYFQPVDMEPSGNSLPAAQSDMHIEADISAAEGNELGYGVGDFVPNLTVKYEIEDSSGKIQEGSFMPMSASDGPHYGANVKIGPAGTYKVRFIIESPEEQGYLLHTDAET
ncbi:MAG: iron transporter, partial [Coriobacteriales bacterium]|nr:iron transporter [Coriobacteriales bacterium]